MAKVHIGSDGKITTYGLDGESLKNYRKFGIYARDDDPRLQPPRRWWTRLTAVFR